jgi:hypothetical protein
MKATIKLAGALAMGVIAGTTFAGQKTSYGVYIQPIGATPSAVGDLGGTRNSADSISYIGCAASATIGSCFAQDSAGVYKGCSTTNPAMIALILSINDDTRLSFGWNPDGTCRALYVQKESDTAPK